MSDTPILSLVTGTINRPDQLDRLVGSIYRHTVVPFELIIMDASEHPSKSYSVPEIRYIHEKPRLGHTKGYNVAFQLCRGEYVLWLNDDAEVRPGYDIAGIDLLRLNPDIGLGAYYYHQDGKYHVNICFQMVFANFGILRRDLGNRIGWFDEDFVMYGADNSLTFKVLLDGLGIATVPGANIIHHSEKDAMRLENEKDRVHAPRIMSEKYGSPETRRKMLATYNKTRHLVGPRILAVV